MQYKAIRKCQYDQHIWKEGELLEFPGKTVPCPVCKGEGCIKCHKTGRIDPPHHFMPVTHVNVVEKKAEVDAEISELDAIRAEMDEMGKAYDRRWKLQKMRDALIAAKKETGK